MFDTPECRRNSSAGGTQPTLERGDPLAKKIAAGNEVFTLLGDAIPKQ